MALTLGISNIDASGDALSITAVVTAAGSVPYTYQWYRSTTSGFTPGGGNIVTGATSATLVDGMAVGKWFYACIVTDSLSATSTATTQGISWHPRTIKPSTQVDVTTGAHTSDSIYGFGQPGYSPRVVN